MISSTILLINPPAVSPVYPCWDAAVVAGALKDSGLNPCRYDANLDFYRTHIFSKESVHFYFNRIQKKKRSGQISDETYLILKKMYETCEAGVDIKAFKGEPFYDPGYYILLKNKINACLSLASHADYHSNSTAASHGVGGVNGNFNPLVLLCEQGLEKSLKRHDPSIVVFFVSSPEQALAVQTMAAFIKLRYPGFLLLAMTNIGPNLLDSCYFDRLFLNQGQNGLVQLADFLNQARGIKMNLQSILPDFGGISLDDYLTPEPMVLVHPLFFKDPVCLSGFLEDLVRSRGVKGFIFAQSSFLSDAPDGKMDLADCALPENGGKFSTTKIFSHLSYWFSRKQPHIYFSLLLGMEDFPPGSENIFSNLFSSGLRLIHWEGDIKKTRIPEKRLWEASKQGVWNHVCVNLFSGQDSSDQTENTKENRMDIRDQNKGEQNQRDQDHVDQNYGDRIKFILNNPNIVHSFQDINQYTTQGAAQKTGQSTGQTLIQDKYASLSIPQKYVTYAKVQPLPGIPFWNLLSGGYLLVYLSLFSRKSLGSLRADLTNQAVLCLGSRMNFTYQSPKDLPPGVLDEICKMVEAGGSVDITHVRFNLERAYKIGYAMENGVIIGNSSLKHPRAAFIKRLKQMTGVDFTHFVERGYTSVRPEYRAMGVGAKLLEGLTKRAKDYKVFSIISEQNLATQKIALRNNTKKILTYFSEKLNKRMGVWMPEEMIDWPIDKEKDKDRDKDRES